MLPHYVKYMYLKYVFDIQNSMFYFLFKYLWKNVMYFVFKIVFLVFLYFQNT